MPVGHAAQSVELPSAAAVTEPLLGHPGDRDVLAGDEITDIGPQGRSVAGRRSRVGREGPGRLCSTTTAPPLGLVLGAKERDRREVEDLAADDPGHLCVGEVLAALLTVVRPMDRCLIGIDTLGQMVPGVAGLLAGFFARAHPARFGCGLLITVRRRRLRRVA
jgi:hypothetical protein